MIALLYALAALSAGNVYQWTYETFWGDFQPYSETCKKFIRTHRVDDPKVVVRPAVVDSLQADYQFLDVTYSDYRTKVRESPVISFKSLKIQSVFVKVNVEGREHLLGMTDYYEMAHRELVFRFHLGDSAWVVFRDGKAERMLRVTESKIPCLYEVDRSGVEPIVRVMNRGVDLVNDTTHIH